MCSLVSSGRGWVSTHRRFPGIKDPWAAGLPTRSLCRRMLRPRLRPILTPTATTDASALEARIAAQREFHNTSTR